MADESPRTRAATATAGTGSANGTGASGAGASAGSTGAPSAGLAGAPSGGVSRPRGSATSARSAARFGLEQRPLLRTNATPRTAEDYLAQLGREDDLLSDTAEPPPAAEGRGPATRVEISIRRPTTDGRAADEGPAAPRDPKPAPSELPPLQSSRSAALAAALGPPPGTRTREPTLPRPVAAPPLSPRMTAVFGAIFGLATVASILALLMRASPPRDERALASSSASGSAGASAPLPTAPAPAAGPRQKRVRTPLPAPPRLSELPKESGAVLVTGAMDRRSLLAALDEKKIPQAQTYRVLKAFQELKKFDHPGRKDKFVVLLEKDTKRIRGFEYEVSPLEIYQARENQEGVLVAQKLDMHVTEEEWTASAQIGSDPMASLREAGFEEGILQEIELAFQGAVNADALDEGTVVRIIAVEQTALGRFARYKHLKAVEIRPPGADAKPLRAYWFQGREVRGYFDDRAKTSSSGGWRAPVPGARVTSRFNPKRLHPVLKKVMPHNGTDFGAPSGTPVYSAYRGTVAFIGWGGPSGNLVTISHPNGIETGYAHLSKFAAGLKVGAKVPGNQLVGYVGSTGRSTGPHLHFSAKKDGKFFDAETLKLDSERVLPASEKGAFTEQRAELDKLLDAIPDPPPPAPKAAKPAASSGAPPAEGAPPSGSAPPPSAGGRAAPPAGADDDDDEGGGSLVGPALGAGAAPKASASPATPEKDDE